MKATIAISCSIQTDARMCSPFRVVTFPRCCMIAMNPAARSSASNTFFVSASADDWFSAKYAFSPGCASTRSATSCPSFFSASVTWPQLMNTSAFSLIVLAR
jgi:hypothetical protein